MIGATLSAHASAGSRAPSASPDVAAFVSDASIARRVILVSLITLLD
jgi:hypothetical protein